MKKSEIIATIAQNHNLSQKQAKAIFDDIFILLAQGLTQSEIVQIKDFGTFERVNRAERMGRNPKTGEQMLIKASKSVKFKPSKAIKDKLNG